MNTAPYTIMLLPSPVRSMQEPITHCPHQAIALKQINNWIHPVELVATQCRPGNAHFAVHLVMLPEGTEPPSLTLLDEKGHEHHHDSWPCSPKKCLNWNHGDLTKFSIPHCNRLSWRVHRGLSDAAQQRRLLAGITTATDKHYLLCSLLTNSWGIGGTPFRR